MGVLDGKVAIVTGSARGIGRATAEILSEHGASILVNDLDEDAAKQAADEIGGQTAVFGGDLTKGDAPERLVQAAIDAFGKVDIVVNNAGYTLDGPIHKMTDDAWDRMLAIHVSVPFKVLRAVAPHFREPAKREAAEGREVFRKIVNVSSASGTMGSAAQANYASAKAAVVGLTKTLAKEWGQFKVNSNAVAFGLVSTRLIAPKQDENRIDVDGRSFPLGMPPELRDAAAGLVPLGRASTPEEAAGAIFFLCSPWSNYVTGQVLTVTGGLTVGMSS
jgi:3-oxoacyl-[acyl-carrier protein] reductase